MSCNHTFPYWSVIPPSHCPCCGACLHPVGVYPAPYPYPAPRPYPPNKWWPPYYTVTSSTSAHVQQGTPMNAMAS